MRSRKWLVAERVLWLILSIRRLIELISNLGEINGVETDKCQVGISGMCSTNEWGLHWSLCLIGILGTVSWRRDTSPRESIFAKLLRICQSHLRFIAERITSMKLIVRSCIFFFYLYQRVRQILFINCFLDRVADRIFITFSSYITLGEPFRINTRFYLLFLLCFYHCLHIACISAFINNSCNMKNILLKYVRVFLIKMRRFFCNSMLCCSNIHVPQYVLLQLIFIF